MGSPTPAAPSRLASLDAYRGLMLALMMGEALRFCAVSAALPASGFWAFLCRQQDHVPWAGGSLHDQIQPGFSFLVGAALPFSLAARRARGDSRGRTLRHAFRRALVLVALGIVLRSLGRPQTYFTFEDTLTQIGLGYVFLVALALRPRRDQWLAFALILAGFWAAFARYPAPGPGFDWPAVGVPADWPELQTGFAAHWNKNENFSAQFDRWFLNRFPREQPFVYNKGGYQTLSFVPTLATMLLGLLAGGVLRSDRSTAGKRGWLVGAGVVCLAGGGLVAALGLCPIVKRIWTPSFVLWSGGLCLLFTALFFEILDVRERRCWAFPLFVLGMNSIAAYCLYEALEKPLREALLRHFTRAPFQLLGAPLEPALLGAASLSLIWLALWWMYRRRVFVRL